MSLQLLYPAPLIHERIATVAAEISKDYAGRTPLLIGVLKGCVVFMSHLLVNITGEVEIDFVTLQSYGAGTHSGTLTLLKDVGQDLHGREVLVVEDIIDTGKTVAFLKKHLLDKGAAQVEVVAFVNKTTRRTEEVPRPKYVCFDYAEAPFVVGFGFDLNERYRNLPEVYQWHED